MDQLMTVFVAITVATGVTGVLIPLLSSAPSPEREADREAALEAQLGMLN